MPWHGREREPRTRVPFLPHGFQFDGRPQHAWINNEEAQLAINQYLKHYNAERNHQGIGNQLIGPEILSRDGDITSKKRLGGMLTYYYRQAA